FTFNEIAMCRDIINKTLFENPECSDYLLHIIIEDSLREYRQFLNLIDESRNKNNL
ncbi:hypothetical protein ABF179_002486, partial [Flavobacterium psychrophilum]